MGARTYRSSRAQQVGLSWIEFSVLCAMFAVFGGSLLTALFYYEELAEAAVVQLTVQNMRSGLRYQIADRLVRGRTSEMAQLLDENPVMWLERPPEGYAGSIRTTDIRNVRPGSWFYDVDMNEVGSVPRHSAYLNLDAGGAPTLRWRTRGIRLRPQDEVEGLALISLTPYRWF